MNSRQDFSWPRSLADAIASLSGRIRGTTAAPLHVRGTLGTEQVLLLFVVASLPAALVGAWSAGVDWLLQYAADPASIAGWRIALLANGGLTMSPDSMTSALAAGLSLLLPLLLMSAAVGIVWEVIFASIRRRNVDPGWAMSAWLFVLLLAPETPLVFAALGMSFGAVFGQHVFGGTGRYVASPAVIGALFLHFAYPTLTPASSTFGNVALLGATQALEQGIAWWPLFAGRETGLLGTGSALAALAGALWLVLRGVASLRTLGGAVVGLFAASQLAVSLGGSLPAHWQFALGNVAFCWAFVLTDPTTQPLTKSGRWLYGALFGVLVILMREADPTHPEGTLFAVLLAALLVPLIDYATLRAQRRRYGPRLEVET